MKLAQRFIPLMATLGVLGTSVAADDLPDVMGVFAPGQGTQSGPENTTSPSVFGSQREMFSNLLGAAPDLSNDDLLNYYRPLTFEALPKEDIGSVISPRHDVTITRDRVHNVPRVKGETRQAAMFGAGYARAEDRLWQMDLNRHIWRAKSIELLGRGEEDEHLKQDLIVAQRNDYSEAELQLMFDQLDDRYDDWGEIVQVDLTAYVAGINAFIEKIKAEPGLLPQEYTSRNIEPQP
ncbi:MAG: penicillin acylase family protein, partial [Pseudomonadota bacterium]